MGLDCSPREVCSTSMPSKDKKSRNEAITIMIIDDSLSSVTGSRVSSCAPTSYVCKAAAAV